MNNDVKVEDNVLEEKLRSVKKRYDAPKVLSSMILEAVATSCGKTSKDPISGDCTQAVKPITS